MDEVEVQPEEVQEEDDLEDLGLKEIKPEPK